MAKLNVLHWHLTDTASFPLVVPNQQHLSRNGAASSQEVYSPSDISDLVAYAALYGVEVIPEVDLPAHVGKGWPADMVVCYKNYEFMEWNVVGLEPPSGMLNVANEHVWGVLGDIYGYLRHAFPASKLHLGGDEVLLGNETKGCWNTSAAKPILNMLEQQGFDRNDPKTFHDLLANFTQRSLSLARENGFQKFMFWVGQQGGAGYNIGLYPGLVSVAPPADTTLMVWDNHSDSLAPHLTKLGYDVVLAHETVTYLDFGGQSYWNNDPDYHPWSHTTWQKIYEYMQSQHPTFGSSWNNVLGAQVNLWTEGVNHWEAEIRIWPFAGALAEALWSNPQTDAFEAVPRMMRFSTQLSTAKIPSKQLGPSVCYQGAPRACYDTKHSSLVV